MRGDAVFVTQRGALLGVGLSVSCILAGAIAILVAHGVRELVRTAIELAAVLSVVVLFCLALLLATGAMPY